MQFQTCRRIINFDELGKSLKPGGMEYARRILYYKTMCAETTFQFVPQKNINTNPQFEHR